MNFLVILSTAVLCFSCAPQPEPTSPSEPTHSAVPAQTPSPTTTPPSPSLPTPAFTNWGSPNWGSEYKETAGAKLHLVRKDETIKDGKHYINYYLLAVTLPKDKDYYLWQKKGWEKDPKQIASGSFRINDNGLVVPGQSPQTGPILLAVNAYARGESMEVALMTDDKATIAFGKEIPIPVETKMGNCRMWAELASGTGTMFFIWGEGFEPNTEIDTASSSNGENAKFKTKINSNGTFKVIVLPGVKGKESGVSTFTALGKDGELKVSFEWGKPALLPAQP